MKMALETDRLPNIVQGFLSHADNLRKLVQNATWEIAVDIKAMLYDGESTFFTSYLLNGFLSGLSCYVAGP